MGYRVLGCCQSGPNAVDKAIDGYQQETLTKGWFLIREIEATIGPALAEKFLTGA
jgi:hypothetical protein